MTTFQRHIRSIRLRTEYFSTQTDSFYSYQCNEPIFIVDKWGKSHEKSFYSAENGNIFKCNFEIL